MRTKDTVLTAIGFTSFLIVMDFLLWGAALAPVDGVSPYPWIQIHFAYSLPSTLSLGLALVAASAFLDRAGNRPDKAGRRGVRGAGACAAGCLATIASIALLGLQLFWDKKSPFALTVCAVLASIGIALGLLAWQGTFVRKDSASDCSSTVLGAFLAFPPIAIGCIFLPRTAAYAIALALTCTSWALLWKLRPRDNADAAVPKTPAPAAERPPLAGAFAGWGATFVCLGSFGFVAGVLRSLTLYAVSNRTMVTVESLACIFAATLVLLVVWRVFKARFTLIQFYQIGFPLVAGALVVGALIANDFTAALAGLAHFLLEFSLIVIIVQSIREARERRQDPVVVYGRAVGVAYTLLGLGTAAGFAFRVYDGGPVSTLGLAVIVCIYALSIPLALQLRKYMRRGEEAGEAGSGAEDFDIRRLYAPRLRAVAERHGLTPREEEVVGLILIGRDSPSIAAELGLSDNTVRTHKKNAYRKLGIHSKQDIITLLNDTEAAGSPH